MIDSDHADYPAGRGMHLSLCPYDMHNILIAAGPDFRSGVLDDLPTGNVDVAPTILWVLGLKPPQPMDGRVLTEALTIKGPRLRNHTEPKHIETEGRVGNTVWRQYLNFSQVNGVFYNDKGNGNQIAKQPAQNSVPMNSAIFNPSGLQLCHQEFMAPSQFFVELGGNDEIEEPQTHGSAPTKQADF